MDRVKIDLAGRKILVTDDVPANLDLLFQALDGEGYNVHVAFDGYQTLEVAANSRPDLILLDVMMPGIDGYETCRRLKADETLADTPVIFLTARDDVEGIIEGFQAGGVDYVTKPFKKEEVLARIRTHLERDLLARELAELNTRLEEKVRERTAELQRKVSELEGKDRIIEHMLTLHSLEETMAVVLEAIMGIMRADQVVLYVRRDGEITPLAAIGMPAESLGTHDDRTAEWVQAVSGIEASLEPVRLPLAHPHVLVPITSAGTLLGLIEVQNPNTGTDISDDDLRTLTSFALQAAVALKDAMVNQDPEAWQDQLDEVLELDQEMGVEELDESS